MQSDTKTSPCRRLWMLTVLLALTVFATGCAGTATHDDDRASKHADGDQGRDRDRDDGGEGRGEGHDKDGGEHEAADAITWPTRKAAAPINLAGATDGPLLMALTCAHESVELGSPIEVDVTIRNDGDAPIRIKELVHDTQSLSFAMVWQNSVSFEFEKMVLWNSLPREWEVVDLEPGASVSESFSIPTLVTGPVQIGGRFRGVDEGMVRSNPITVDVRSDAGEGQVVARLKTNFGDIVVRFYPDIAPNTSLHFVELVQKGFYDDVSFHRLIPGFVLQGGDPLGNGSGSAGYNLRAEFNEHKHTAGVLSMARAEDPDSAGSQFFVCLGDAPHLDTTYTAFGEVIEGMSETVRKIESEAELYDDSDQLYEDVYIEKATLETRPLEP